VQHSRLDLIMLDELRYLPLARSAVQWPFHLVNKISKRTSVIFTTNLAFWALPTVFGGHKPVLGLSDS
jgi:DNA replication protein DnaC